MVAKLQSSVTSAKSLADLEMRGEFVHRHIGPDQQQIDSMLEALDLSTLEDLADKVIPDSIISYESPTLKASYSERAVGTYMRKMRARNKVFISMIGLGYYGTIMPPVIKRNVLENPGWYTAYTPYQSEVSQGRLEALLNFQQMIMDLTGMELANASLLDEATAVAEAMTMSKRVSRKDTATFFVDENCFPQTIAVIKTRAESLGLSIVIGDPYQTLNSHDIFGMVVQYPGADGEVRDLRPLIAMAHAQSALVTVAADILSLVLLTPPGEMGADIVVGSSQRFGVSMSYGGPHAAYFATRERYRRAVPGRIVGVSTDKHGQTALRLALQTREQHIRRAKATSNICTSQVLLAIIAGFYAIYHGSRGLRLIAGRVHRLSLILVASLKALGYEIVNQAFFDTITVKVAGRARRLAARAHESGINLRIVDADHLGISLDETTRQDELRLLWRIFCPDPDKQLNLRELDREVKECLPPTLLRNSDFLTHPVFTRYHCETEMMRYMRSLARKDIALDRAMIPLGSCTMKLNAAAEMQALSYREFSAIHPFAPLDQVQGYLQLFEELEEMLCDLTGFDAFSLQPNAGSQGEYAGLLVIRKYHATRDQAHRNICLIPASAHGTNPASAVLAGLDIVVIACDEQGNVDLGDLQIKAEKHADQLAALMITYPSTHGVYEEAFQDICAIVHKYGGQVYLDGANFNALVGICRPAMIGVDLAHINLHKTFSIPHGGGGPGAGPIGVRHHLTQFLPDHPLVPDVNPAARQGSSIGTVAAAPWGSAGILAISWAYIAMMRNAGLRRATLVALLNANYVARRLASHYPVLYTGKNNMVAHECIIDLRQIKESSGVTVDDIAKRLIDYGFHAPTMSFPVADTLMIEPTESENKREIDRFCDAMIAIRREIADLEAGRTDREDNVLKNAPHTQALFISSEWDKPYTIAQAFFPAVESWRDKYWPPVGRVDNLVGDRNLICGCSSMDQ